MTVRPVLVLASLALAAGCSGVTPRFSTTSRDPGGRPTTEGIGGRGPVPSDTAQPGPRGTGRDPADAFPVANAEVRRVCRTAGWGRGWVSTAYVEAPGECPERTDGASPYNAAVITRLGSRPRGTVLEVCADQVVPNGWIRDGDGDPATSARCPGAGKDGAGASMRIRKQR